MEKSIKLIVALCIALGAGYFYLQQRVTADPVEVTVKTATVGKKTISYLYSTADYAATAEVQDSPLVFFTPANAASSFKLVQFEKASEGRSGFGIRFGDGDITTIAPGAIIYVNTVEKTCLNLPSKGWNQKLLDTPAKLANLLMTTGVIE